MAGAPAGIAVIVMGVSGAGKTTIGGLLAERLGWRFHDGDDYHPPANVAKMRAGVPLTDTDRQPWLDRLNALARATTGAGASVVIGCSALKSRYRTWLAADVPSMHFVHLSGSRALIGARLASRTGHFMPPGLLDSQFAALEAPEDAIVVDIDASPAQIVEAIVRQLGDR